MLFEYKRIKLLCGYTIKHAEKFLKSELSLNHRVYLNDVKFALVPDRSAKDRAAQQRLKAQVPINTSRNCMMSWLRRHLVFLM